MNCITVEGLTKQFADKKVVDRVSFQLQEHTATALIGPNGAGKTTTLSMLAGLMQPTNGTISMPNVIDIRSEIGFLPQYPQFYSWMTALEHTEMLAKLSGVASRDAKKQSQKMLEFVGLGNALNKKIGTFSGGMKQRLGISQAIVHSPKLLLLDEPVSALDPVGRREVMDLLKQVQQTTTILYSTHILNDAEEITDQLLFLKAGQLVEQGTLKDVREKYDQPKYVIKFLTQADAQAFKLANLNAGTVKDKEIYIPVENTNFTMNDVLKLVAESDFDIQGVSKYSMTLEEIFMKVAGQHEAI